MSYDKLKAEFDEAMGKKARLEGQLHQAIEDRECYKARRNLSRGKKAKLEERIVELLSRITKLKVEVANLTSQLETEHQRAENASKPSTRARSTSTSRTLTLISAEMRSFTPSRGSIQTSTSCSSGTLCLE